MSDRKKNINKGFTLLEILVSLGIFSVILVICMGIFVSGSNYYRKTLSYLEVQREASYLLEMMSREIRMARTICDDQMTAECIPPATKADQQGNNDSDIEFMNHEGDWLKYCLAAEDGVCDGINGKNVGVNIDGNAYRINSKYVSIEDLKFYVNNFNTGPQQRIITIAMRLRSNSVPDTSMLAQTSVAMRIYNR